MQRIRSADKSRSIPKYRRVYILAPNPPRAQMVTLEDYRIAMLDVMGKGRQVEIGVLVDLVRDKVGATGYDRARAGALANQLIGACKSDRLRAVTLLFNACKDAEGDPIRRAIAWAISPKSPHNQTMTAAQLLEVKPNR